MDLYNPLYILYILNGLAGLLLGGFLYREFQDGFMVLFREQVYSLKWVMVILLLSTTLGNLVWLLKVRNLQQDLPLLLLMFSGVVAPFLWRGVVVVVRFLLVDVLMGFLGEVSDSFADLRKDLTGWIENRKIEAIHHHEDAMEKIRQVRLQWSKRKISRTDAVKKIDRLKREQSGKKNPPQEQKRKVKTKVRVRKKGPPRKRGAKPEQQKMPELMSGFVDKVIRRNDDKK